MSVIWAVKNRHLRLQSIFNVRIIIYWTLDSYSFNFTLTTFAQNTNGSEKWILISLCGAMAILHQIKNQVLLLHLRALTLSERVSYYSDFPIDKDHSGETECKRQDDFEFPLRASERHRSQHRLLEDCRVYSHHSNHALYRNDKI